MARPLTVTEHETLVAMITRAGELSGERTVTADERQAWLARVPDLRVDEMCECGSCPSISLVAEPPARVTEGADRVVLGAALSDGLVLLFIDDGVPSYVELAPHDDETAYAEFPGAAALSY